MFFLHGVIDSGGRDQVQCQAKIFERLESIENPSILAITTASATLARAPEAYNGASQEASPPTTSPASRST